jgi:hypothetical protein
MNRALPSQGKNGYGNAPTNCTWLVDANLARKSRIGYVPSENLTEKRKQDIYGDSVIEF